LAKKQKYYVVWEGSVPGIYTSWDECQNQIKGHASAKYKAFDSKAEAEFAFQRNYFQFIKKEAATPKIKNQSKSDIIADSISVDAACSGNPGRMEYQGVETMSRKKIFYQGPFENGTNNIGEFLALVHALAMLKKLNNSHTCIYTDSKTAMSWVKNKKAKTKLELNELNKILFELIKRAETWLKSNSYETKILKWNTESWGEIPADFGRK
jgi:ribonuclease HI